MRQGHTSSIEAAGTDLTRKRTLAVWDLGFRPFFLLGLLAAPGLMIAWLTLFLNGTLAPSYFQPVLWHAHEMVYGFACAIVIGFIYTAAPKWTGTPGIRGLRLMLLAGIWVTARMLMAFPLIPAPIVAGIDLAFLPLSAMFLVPYLGRKEQRHNLIFLVLLSTLTLGNLLMHFSALGVVDGYDRPGLYLGLNVIIFMIVVIGGRFIPTFSENEVSGYRRANLNILDKTALLSAVAFVIVSFAMPNSIAVGAIAIVATAVNLWLWIKWLHIGIWHIPILWVLYVGYAWIIIGFALTAASIFSTVSSTAATHAFTAGGFGTMIVAMVSRFSLVHTGRPLIAARATVAAYLLVSFAAIVRVVGATLLTGHSMISIQISGALWIASFIVLLTIYAPILIAPRVKGNLG